MDARLGERLGVEVSAQGASALCIRPSCPRLTEGQATEMRGSHDRVARRDVARVSWLDAALPQHVEAGAGGAAMRT